MKLQQTLSVVLGDDECIASRNSAKIDRRISIDMEEGGGSWYFIPPGATLDIPVQPVGLRTDRDLRLVVQLVVGDFVTIDAVTLTAGTDFAIGADVLTTAQNLANSINANATLKVPYYAAVTPGVLPQSPQIVTVYRNQSGPNDIAITASSNFQVQSSVLGDNASVLAMNFLADDLDNASVQFRLNSTDAWRKIYPHPQVMHVDFTELHFQNLNPTEGLKVYVFIGA